MSVSNSTRKNRPDSAAVPPIAPTDKSAGAESKNLDCYDRLVTEIETLDCIHATLVAWDLADGEKPSIGSAELVLRECIRRLYDIGGDVLTVQEQAGSIAEVAMSEITPIRPVVTVGTPKLHPAVHFLLDEQLDRLNSALSIIQLAELAIRQVYDCDALGNPQIDKALRTAYDFVYQAFCNLDPEQLDLAPHDAEVLKRMKDAEEVEEAAEARS